MLSQLSMSVWKGILVKIRVYIICLHFVGKTPFVGEVLSLHLLIIKLSIKHILPFLVAILLHKHNLLDCFVINIDSQ